MGHPSVVAGTDTKIRSVVETDSQKYSQLLEQTHQNTLRCRGRLTEIRSVAELFGYLLNPRRFIMQRAGNQRHLFVCLLIPPLFNGFSSSRHGLGAVAC